MPAEQVLTYTDMHVSLLMATRLACVIPLPDGTLGRDKAVPQTYIERPKVRGNSRSHNEETTLPRMLYSWL